MLFSRIANDYVLR